MENVKPADRKMRKRLVSVVAVSVEVHCPHCGDPLPSPTGSHLWTSDELRAVATHGEGLASCSACDEPIILDMPAAIGWL